MYIKRKRNFFLFGFEEHSWNIFDRRNAVELFFVSEFQEKFFVIFFLCSFKEHFQFA
jgi:hypothetical protein